MYFYLAKKCEYYTKEKYKNLYYNQLHWIWIVLIKQNELIQNIIFNYPVKYGFLKIMHIWVDFGILLSEIYKTHVQTKHYVLLIIMFFRNLLIILQILNIMTMIFVKFFWFLCMYHKIKILKSKLAWYTLDL